MLGIGLSAALNTINEDTTINGYMQAKTPKYPVVEGERTKEDATDPAQEFKYARTTKSALTATRKSTLYTKSQFQAGFGSDISFETVDKNNVHTELGAIGMQATGDGSSAADIVFKVWNGADTSGYKGDETGAYNKMVIKANGDVHIQGNLYVNGEQINASSAGGLQDSGAQA